MLRLGVKEYTRRILTNLFIALQLAAAFFIIASIIASIRTRTTLYDPIKDYLDGDGAYMHVTITTLGEQGIDTEEKLKEYIPEIDEVITTYSTSLETDERIIQTIAYDKRTGGTYTPELKEGKWIDFGETDEITAVIDYDSPYKVGDVIDLDYSKFIGMTDDFQIIDEKYPQKVRIVGRLAEKAKLYGLGRGFAQNDDFRNLYDSYVPDEDDDVLMYQYQPLFIVSKEAVESKGCSCYLRASKAIVTFKDGLTEEQADAAFSRLNTIGTPIRMEPFATRTKRYVFDQLIQLSPILISIIMLTVVSTIAISALNAKMGMKTNAVYALLGCTMKDCIGIYLINSLFTAFTSALMCIVFVNGMKITGRLQNTVISFGKYELAGCGVMLVIFLLCAITAPVIYLAKATIKEQLAVSE